MNNLRYEPDLNSDQLQSCVQEEVGFKVKLSNPSSAAPTIQMHSLDEHFSNSAQFYTPEHSFPYLMKNSTIFFVVDGYFCHERSSIISSAWRCSLDENKLVTDSVMS